MLVKTIKGEYTGVIMRSIEGFYFRTDFKNGKDARFHNDDIFYDLNLNPYEYQEKVLGYSDYIGCFPYCRTEKDVNKLLDALSRYGIGYIPKRKFKKWN